jgi:dolichyl-phosphate-mannose--protein O-mannosyl transferase
MISVHFQSTLIGNWHYKPSARASFWYKLADVHHSVRYGNAELEHATHAGASKWYTWPIMKHPIGWWMPTSVPSGTRQMIILLGNPVVWWGALVGFFVGLAAFLFRRARFAGREFSCLFLLGCVLLNYVPFAAIKRLMYLYHYLFALTLLIAFAAFSTGVLAGWMDEDTPLFAFPTRRSAALYWGIVALMLIGFVYFLPFTYGWPMSTSSWDAHFWVLHPQL